MSPAVLPAAQKTADQSHRSGIFGGSRSRTRTERNSAGKSQETKVYSINGGDTNPETYYGLKFRLTIEVRREVAKSAGNLGQPDIPWASIPAVRVT